MFIRSVERNVSRKSGVKASGIRVGTATRFSTSPRTLLAPVIVTRAATNLAHPVEKIFLWKGNTRPTDDIILLYFFRESTLLPGRCIPFIARITVDNVSGGSKHPSNTLLSTLARSMIPLRFRILPFEVDSKFFLFLKKRRFKGSFENIRFAKRYDSR